MHDHGSTHNTPRWVKTTGIIVIALLPLFGSLHLIGMSLLGHASGGHGGHVRRQAPLNTACYSDDHDTRPA